MDTRRVEGLPLDSGFTDSVDDDSAMSSETVLICRNESYLSDDESAVLLSELFDRIDEDEAQEMYERLTNLQVKQKHSTPLYALISSQLPGSGQYHEGPPYFDHLFALYRLLTEYVNSETERIVVRGVSGRTLDVIRDLADNEGLQLETEAVEPESTDRYRQLLTQVPWLLMSVIDALLSLLLRPVYNESDAGVLVKYPMFRPGTFSPIEDQLTVPFDATFTLLTITCLRESTTVNDATNVVPFRCFASVSDHLKGYYAVIKALVDVTLTHETESAVVAAVEAETGIRMERTVSEIFSRCAVNNLDAYLYYPTAEQLFNSDAYETVVITSGGPSGQTLTVPATDCGVRTVHLGHSIVTPPQPVEVWCWDVHFVEGTIAENLTRGTGQTDIVPVGLPKHVDIYERYGQSGAERTRRTDTHERRRLLVGTQPYPDEYLRTLLRDVVVPAIEQADWTVVIKHHPMENSEFYREVLSELGYPPNETDRVSVVSEGLYEWIRDSDLMLTVTSNVGIEAVVLGTPAAVYNVWQPLIRTPLYARYGPVPHLQSSDDVLELLTDDFDTVAEWEQQQRLIEGPYDVVGNSIDQIAEAVEAEVRCET